MKLMKLVLECRVESDVVLPRRLEVKNGSRTYHFEIDEQRRFNLLRVIADIKRPTRYTWKTEPVVEPRKPNQAPFTINANLDPTLYANLIKDIQAIESTLGVLLHIKSIDWRFPTVNVLAEPGDNEERVDAGFTNLRVSREVPRGLISIDEAAFVQAVGVALKSHDLAMIESFWREGENDWLTGRYINAFYNFYFVLEGLHAPGKGNNRYKAVRFKQSLDLQAAFKEWYGGQHPISHLEQLGKMLRVAETGKLPTDDEFIDKIVEIRGRLHHFRNDQSGPQGSPFEHDNYIGNNIPCTFSIP